VLLALRSGSIFDVGSLGVGADGLRHLAATVFLGALLMGCGDAQRDRYLVRGDLMLDTSTGRTWRLTSHPELQGQPEAWEPIPRLESREDVASFLRQFKRAPAPADQRPSADAMLGPSGAKSADEWPGTPDTEKWPGRAVHSKQPSIEEILGPEPKTRNE
jgi:hypothetical protein